MLETSLSVALRHLVAAVVELDTFELAAVVGAHDRTVKLIEERSCAVVEKTDGRYTSPLLVSGPVSKDHLPPRTFPSLCDLKSCL